MGVVVPHYFDYVRARNLLDGLGLDYAQCSEYADGRDVSLARQLLPEARTPMVLMTERFYALRRDSIPGVRHWVFLGIPG